MGNEVISDHCRSHFCRQMILWRKMCVVFVILITVVAIVIVVVLEVVDVVVVVNTLGVLDLD